MTTADRIFRIAGTRTGRRRRPRPWLALTAMVIASIGFTGSAAAAGHGHAMAAPRAAATQASPVNRLDAVTPVVTCGQLATLDLAAMTGTAVSVASATTTTATPGGWTACDVHGNIAPQEQFEAFLPTGT